MNSIKKKKDFRNDKPFLKSLKEASGLDETKIEFFGDLSDPFSKRILYSYNMSLSCKHKLEKWIVNMEGLSGRKFRYFINNLLGCFTFPSYLEIGCWLGSTSCSASYKNKLNLTCVDDWSQTFDSYFELKFNKKDFFEKNIKKALHKDSQLKIISQDFASINYNNICPCDVYFYDGPHHKKNHFESLEKVQNCFKEKFIFIVDDWNWTQVREGTFEGLEFLNLKIISKLEIKTTLDDSKVLIEGKNSDWHNGYCIFVIEKK